MEYGNIHLGDELDWFAQKPEQVSFAKAHHTIFGWPITLLTHWGLVTNIYALVIWVSIGSGNGLSSGRRKAIT